MGKEASLGLCVSLRRLAGRWPGAFASCGGAFAPVPTFRAQLGSLEEGLALRPVLRWRGTAADV